MRDSRKKVLILDGGAAHAVAIAYQLHNAGYYVAVMCSSRYEYGYHTKFADDKYIGINSESKKYPEFVLNFLSDNKFDVLIPTSDKTAEFISLYKKQLQKHTRVLMPDYDIFKRAYDKNSLMTLCAEEGYPHPKTVDLSGLYNNTSTNSELVRELKEFPYPALVKPNITSGGRGMKIVRSYEELMQAYPSIHKNYGACHLQEYVSPGGRQLKVQIMTDSDGVPAYSSVIWKQRYYPVNGGSSCCNTTITDTEITRICGNVLRSIGWVGFADFDLIEDPISGKVLIMEINPRLPACIRSAFLSGIDYATLIVDASLGKPLQTYTYTPGITLRHLGFEVLWFIKSPNRFKTIPSWFGFWGRDIYYQDWVKGDFLAFFYGSLGNIKKQMDPEFRKKKNGVKI